MEKAEVFYDHYKETMHMHLDMQKKRNMLFVAVCIFELLNLFMLLFPNEIAKSITQYIHTTYQVVFNFNIASLQSAVWIALSYTIVRYFQSNIYIERQYSYIGILEDRLSEILDEPSFNRETDNYLNDYPKVLDLIHVFYTWVIPVSIIVLNIMKSVCEWRLMVDFWSVVFDTICSGFCIVLTVLYLMMLHPKKKKP